MEIVYLYSNDILKDKMSNDTPIVCTIGVFDGIHIGHKLIFDKLKVEADKLNAKTMVITFDPHPDYVLAKRNDSGYVLLLDERINAFRKLGVDYCCIVKCDQTLVNMSYQEFNARFLAEIDAIVVGNDFCYGNQGKGNYQTLKEICAKVFAIDVALYHNNQKIGSDLIRKLIMVGDVEEANKLLISPYVISGIVKKGKSIGGLMGIKTANIILEEKELVIKNGVYKCKVIVDGTSHQAICNIGNNPTISSNNQKTLEAHLLDFNDDLYDKYITVELEKFIRDEKKFASLEELKKQIEIDIKEVTK